MRKILVFAVLIAVALASLGASAGNAQSAQVLILPASSMVAPGEAVTVEIWVRDVVELYGADVSLAFDPALLQVEDANPDRSGVQIAPGNWLDAASLFEARNTAVNESGVITYTVVLKSPAPPVSGSGVLARITFRARVGGSSPVVFTQALLGNQHAESIPVTVSGATIVVSGATATPAPTQTATPTPTPTRTPAGVPSPTPIQAIEAIALGDAARSLGWPGEVIWQPPLYKIQYVAAEGHSTEAWIQRYDRAEEAHAVLLQQRDALANGGWDVQSVPFHGHSAYQASHSLNFNSFTLPMNERMFVFQGSTRIVGVSAFDDTADMVAPDPQTVAEAVYQAGLRYHLFEEVVSSIFLPIILRGYPSPPTPSPTFPTSTTPSPTPTASATPGAGYAQLIENPSFETNLAWNILQTTYPASYSVSRAHTGQRSMRLGVDTGYNVLSYSSVQQTVEIPSSVTRADLTCYYFPVSTRTDGDRIYFIVLRASDNVVLQSHFWTDTHQAWNQRSLDLRGFAGQRIILRFGVKNDGLGGVTAVYLDDVEVWVTSSE